MARPAKATARASAVTVEPRVRLKLPHGTGRLAFSRDGRILQSNAEPYESHAVDLQTGNTLVGETLAGGLTHLMGFANEMLQAAQAGQGSEPAMPEDIMHREFGGPQLTSAGRAMATTLEKPTGIEPFDQAAGLTKKPRYPGRRLSPNGDLFVVVDEKTLAVHLIDSRTHDVKGRVAAKAADALPLMEFAGSGTRFAIAIADHNVGIYDVANVAKPVAILSGHLASITAVALSADGALAASADETGHVAVWSLPAGTAVGWLNGFDIYSDSLAFACCAQGPMLVASDERTFGLFDAQSLQPRVRMFAQAMRAKTFTAVAASADGASIAIGVGQHAMIFDTAALLRLPNALPRDKVKLVPAPSDDAQREERQALVRLFAAPLEKLRARIDREMSALFDRLPPRTARIHFEAYFGPWVNDKGAGIYWAAQDRKGRCLVAYRLAAAGDAVQKGFKASRKAAKKLTIEHVVAGESEAVTNVVMAAWRAAKASVGASKVRGVLSIQLPNFHRALVDLDTGEALDYAAHRFPK